jgi:hypothetical protein
MLWILGRVFQNHHVLALTDCVTQFGDGGGRIFQQPFLIRWVDPRARNYAGSNWTTTSGSDGLWD